MPSPCIVIAIFTPKPEHFEQVKDSLLAITPEVHDEPGCELYALHEGVDGTLVFIEKWTTRELWVAHSSFHTVTRIKAAVEGLLEKPINVRELYGLQPESSYPASL